MLKECLDPLPPLTVLMGGVVHPVRPVCLICDEGVGAGAGRVGHVHLKVAPSTLVESSSINDEVGRYVPQGSCKNIQRHVRSKDLQEVSD